MKVNKLIYKIAIGLLAMSILSLLACSKSDRKRVAVTPAVVTSPTGTGTTITTCQHCTESEYIASAAGDSNPRFNDSYQFRLNFFYVNDSSDDVAVDGELDLHNLQSVGNCSFLPGRYSVATVNSAFGYLENNGRVEDALLEARNGQEVIRLYLDYATFDMFSRQFVRGCDGKDYPSPLGARLEIDSLNGQRCNFPNGDLKVMIPVGDQRFNCSVQ